MVADHVRASGIGGVGVPEATDDIQLRRRTRHAVDANIEGPWDLGNISALDASRSQPLRQEIASGRAAHTSDTAAHRGRTSKVAGRIYDDLLVSRRKRHIVYAGNVGSVLPTGRLIEPITVASRIGESDTGGVVFVGIAPGISQIDVIAAYCVV